MPLRAWWNCRDCVQCDCGIYGCHYPISVSGAWKRSAPGTAPRPARTAVLFQRRDDYCHTLGFNLQVMCHNKCWTVLEGKAKVDCATYAGQRRCWVCQQILFLCANVSLQSSQCVGCLVISFRLSKRPFSYIYDWGKAFCCSDISRVAPALGASHVRSVQLCVHVLSHVSSHYFAFWCTASSFLCLAETVLSCP